MSSDGDETHHGESTVPWSPGVGPDGSTPVVDPGAAAPAEPARSWTVAAPVAPPGDPWAAPAPAGPPAAWGAPPADGRPAYGPPGYGPGGYGPPGYGPPPGAPVPGSEGSGRGVWVAFGIASVLALCAVAFLLVAVVVTVTDDDDVASEAVVATEATDAAETGPTTTLPGGRLAPEPPIPATDGPHEFFFTEPDGDPVAWDPCDAIHYVVNSRLAPEGAMTILDDAIALVEQATGLVFVDDGATDETAPVGEEIRPDSDPGRYGDGWSPVLISWTDAMADPELDGAAGLASPTWWEAASGEQVYITGYVEMAGDYAAALIVQGGRDDVLGIMMHELGHLVGLGHVTPSDQVMTDDPDSTPSVWGNGDLVGLAAVGRGECAPDL